MKPLRYTAALLTAILCLSGCQILRVHSIDLPQGTPISAETARQIQIGMSAEQVLYILGSPARQDVLTPNRWDYIYDYRAGTDGKRAGKRDIQNASRYVRVYFNQGRVVRVEGINSLTGDRP